MLFWREVRFLLRACCALFCLSAVLPAQSVEKVREKFDTTQNASRSILSIPKLDRAPSLEDFAGMEPNGMAAKMAHAENFTQADPKDGEPVTEKTDAYLGYDAKNIYVVYLAYDSQPNAIRGRMTRRENAFDDDFVELTLDTYKDKRRGFTFWANPLGIQAEATWTEGSGPDWSWDTVWKTEGRRTEKGYMVLMSIPFRSLRFTSAQMQDWGIVLLRVISRKNEWSYWPHISSKVNGRLNQAGTLSGMESISPGRNMQFIPYGIMRSYRAIDDRGTTPRFGGETVAGDVGMDAKIVLRDRFALDFTVNPDFSQVESDSPQVTVNQRFEVFFPEKRPFFLENASYFRTPIDLAFTRRIADPNYGIRLTGKEGKYAVGALFADDSSPGKSVLRGDPLDEKKAYFGLLRVNRDVGKENSVGIIYAHREFEGDSNRVGGVDGRFKWAKNYFMNFQALSSSTQYRSGDYQAGPSYNFSAGYEGHKFNINTLYQDTGEGFLTKTGRFRRPEIRRVSHFANYRWRPAGKKLVSWGPNFWIMHQFDRSGKRLEYIVNPSFDINFRRNTWFGTWAEIAREKLRPRDFSSLTTDVDFPRNFGGIYGGSDFLAWLGIRGEYYMGHAINFIHPVVPSRAIERGGNVTLMFKPMDKLQVDNSYIIRRSRDAVTSQNVFNNHIVRSKVNYQINRELSLRFIGQYNATLAGNPATSTVPTDKGFNADFLVTYLLNPGTAVYVGYNSNLTNLDPNLAAGPNGDYLRTNRFINDGKQVFIKISYLFRY